jgi:hypothetical protein
MAANWDFEVTVNVFSDGQPIRKRNFGLLMLATDDVGGSFTELYRLYNSNSEVQQDDDLNTEAKAAGAAFYSQTVHPRQFGIAKVTYASLATDLDTLLAAFNGFYAVACADRTKTTQNALADWTLANDRLAIVQSSDSDILAGTALNLFETLNGDNNGRAAGIWADDDTEYQDVGWAAMGLSPDMDNQSSVWYDRVLSGMTTADVTAAQQTTVTGYGGNLFLDFYGVSKTSPGTLFTEGFIDDLVINDWFKARAEEALAALKLRKVAQNSKISFTNRGMNECGNEIRGVFNVGVAAGHFSPDEELVLDIPDISEVSAAEITARGFSFSGTIIRAGAIKDITFNVGILAA